MITASCSELAFLYSEVLVFIFRRVPLILAILPIVLFPEKILQQKCDKITSFDKKLAKLLNNMYETMVEADGVGLLCTSGWREKASRGR